VGGALVRARDGHWFNPTIFSECIESSTSHAAVLRDELDNLRATDSVGATTAQLRVRAHSDILAFGAQAIELDRAAKAEERYVTRLRAQASRVEELHETHTQQTAHQRGVLGMHNAYGHGTVAVSTARSP